MATNGGGVLPNCQKQHKTKKNTQKKPKKIPKKILAPVRGHKARQRDSSISANTCASPGSATTLTLGSVEFGAWRGDLPLRFTGLKALLQGSVGDMQWLEIHGNRPQQT